MFQVPSPPLTPGSDSDSESTVEVDLKLDLPEDLTEDDVSSSILMRMKISSL